MIKCLKLLKEKSKIYSCLVLSILLLLVLSIYTNCLAVSINQIEEDVEFFYTQTTMANRYKNMIDSSRWQSFKDFVNNKNVPLQNYDHYLMVAYNENGNTGWVICWKDLTGDLEQEYCNAWNTDANWANNGQMRTKYNTDWLGIEIVWNKNTNTNSQFYNYYIGNYYISTDNNNMITQNIDFPILLDIDKPVYKSFQFNEISGNDYVSFYNYPKTYFRFIENSNNQIINIPQYSEDNQLQKIVMGQNGVIIGYINQYSNLDSYSLTRWYYNKDQNTWLPLDRNSQLEIEQTVTSDIATYTIYPQNAIIPRNNTKYTI